MNLPEASSGDDKRFRSILKSTSLIGGASLINILISMVRTKFVAVLLGPSGVGLMSMFNQITSLVGSITGMGIETSGVRQIAEAFGTKNDERIARTVTTLRRTAFATGLLGTLTMVFLSVPISRLSFGSDEHALSIAFLGVTLFFGAIAAGQSCLLRGSRRINDLAKITVIGALRSTLISIPCFYFWGMDGIVVSLLLSSFVALVTSWLFARRVKIMQITMLWRESRQEARILLTIGVGFMGGALASVGTTYLIRALLIQRFGLDDLGIYQAAFSLSGILVGFVLGAMGTDYYPRLTAVATDNVSVRSMVNEQSQISILLALPGLAAMMVFAPQIIRLFYTSSFVESIPILRWFIFGILARVFAWPLGYILMAKGRAGLGFATEVIANCVYLIAIYYFTSTYGLMGAAFAFVTMYIVYNGMMLAVMHGIVGGTWSKVTITFTLFSVFVITILMLNVSFNQNWLSAWSINILILIMVFWFCFDQLSKRSSINLKALLARIGLKRRDGAK